MNLIGGDISGEKYIHLRIVGSVVSTCILDFLLSMRRQ